MHSPLSREEDVEEAGSIMNEAANTSRGIFKRMMTSLWMMVRWVWVRFKGCFVLDVRSLAFYRIMMGLTVIGDLVDRGRDMIYQYSDDGAVPRTLAIDKMSEDVYSLYLLNGTPEGM